MIQFNGTNSISGINVMQRKPQSLNLFTLISVFQSLCFAPSVWCYDASFNFNPKFTCSLTVATLGLPVIPEHILWPRLQWETQLETFGGNYILWFNDYYWHNMLVVFLINKWLSLHETLVHACTMKHCYTKEAIQTLNAWVSRLVMYSELYHR